MKKYLAILLLLFCDEIFAQGVEKDRLSAKNLLDRADVMLDIGENYKSDSILLYSQQAANKFLRDGDSAGVLKSLHVQMQVYAIKKDEPNAKLMNDSIMDFCKKAVGDCRLSKAQAHEHFGLLYSYLGRNDQAIIEYSNAIEIYRSLYGDDFPELAKIYSNIGNVYYNKEDLENSLKFHLSSIELCKKYYGEHSNLYSKILFNTGNDYSDLSEFDAALDYYNKSLNIKKELLGDKHLNIAFLYDMIGNVYESKSLYDTALVYYNKSLQIIKSNLGDNHLETAALYNSIAGIYKKKDEYRKALDYYYKCLDIRKQQLGENNPLVAGVFNNLAVVYTSLADLDLALDYLHKSLKIHIALGNDGQMIVAILYNNIGTVLIDKSEYDKALEYLFKSLEIRKNITGEKNARVALVYNNIGNIYNYKRELDKALEYYRRSLDIYLEVVGEKHNAVGGAYVNIGSAYCDKGEYSKALDCYRKALEIRRAILGEKHTLIANLYSSIGNIYLHLNNVDSALYYNQKGLDMKIDLLGENHTAVSVSYNNIGLIYEYTGEYEKSIECYNKSLVNQIMAYGKKHAEVALNYNNIGNIFFLKGDFLEALKYYQRSLTANMSFFNDSCGYATPFKVDSYLDPYELLKSLSQKAIILGKLAITMEKDSSSIELLIYNFGGQIASVDELFRLSLENFIRCDTVIEQTRKKVNNANDKIMLGETAQAIYAQAINVCYAFLKFSLGEKKQTIEKAFYFAEQGKGMVLLQALAESEGLKYSGIPDSLIERERSLKVDIAFYEGKLAEELDSATNVSFQNRAFSAKRQYEDLILFLEKNYPNYYNLKYSNTKPGIDEIQNQLAKNCAMCNYVLGDSSIYLFTITRNSVDFYAVEHIAGFEDSIQVYRSALSGNPQFANRYLSCGLFLYQKLFPKNLSFSSNIDNIIVVPDGSMAFIPFESLPMTSALGIAGVAQNQDSLRGFKTLAVNLAGGDFRDYPFLIKKYNISYCYSATLYFQNYLGKQQHSRIRKGKDWLAVAPVFSDNERIATPQTLDLQRRMAFYRSDTLSIRGNLLNGDYVNPLPGTETEVESISTMFTQRGYSVNVLLKNQASEKFIKSGILDKYSILHFATHGFVNSEKPELSGLLLAQDSAGGNDGILYSSEIYNLRLNADLTVLSACETGLGKVRKGEGIIGLTRALIYAGSRNIIVSLWPVSDQSTSTLMVDFYSNLLRGRRSENYSVWLRKAKLKMINRGTYSNPFYWSPFILVGQ